MSVPTRPEVMMWWTRQPARTGQGAVVDHFWPGARGPDRERLLNRVKGYRKRARKKEGRKPRPDPAPVAIPPPGPVVDSLADLAAATDSEAYHAAKVRQYEDAIAEMLAAGATRNASAVGTLGNLALKHRRALENLREGIAVDWDAMTDVERLALELESVPEWDTVVLEAAAAELERRRAEASPSSPAAE